MAAALGQTTDTASTDTPTTGACRRLASARAAIEAGERCGRVPVYGSPAWHELPARDLRWIASAWRAAERWRLDGEPAAIAERIVEDDLVFARRIRQMSYDVAGAEDWAGVADREARQHWTARSSVRMLIVMPPGRASVAQLTVRGRETRHRIVTAAATLFQERGVAGTSKSQLYHYFTDKSALVRAVVDWQVEQVLRRSNRNSATLTRWLHYADGPTASSRSTHTRHALAGVRSPGWRASSERATPTHGRSWSSGSPSGWTNWPPGYEMCTRGELTEDADPETLGLGLLAAVQGGLLLARTTRSLIPLRVALDHGLESIERRVS